MWPFRRRRWVSQPPSSDDDQLLRQRTVLISGPIDEDSATKVIAKLLFLQSESNWQPIRLLIDSPGGQVAAGMAVIETIQLLLPPVRTACCGSAVGMAAVILASGQKGERAVVRNGSVVLTPVSSPAPPDEPELQRVRNEIVRILADATCRDPAQVSKDMEMSKAFGCNAAVEYGLADRVDE